MYDHFHVVMPFFTHLGHSSVSLTIPPTFGVPHIEIFKLYLLYLPLIMIA